ncbi:hypothetical protein QTP88_015016 [Uroleucon formosanum]
MFTPPGDERPTHDCNGRFTKKDCRRRLDKDFCVYNNEKLQPHRNRSYKTNANLRARCLYDGAGLFFCHCGGFDIICTGSYIP